jgi:hypothetical protein
MRRASTPINRAFLGDMEDHLQTFVYSFMPALFSDITANADSGFTEQQTRQINFYFDHATTICAIAYPYRTYLYFGGLTHLRIRKLHKLFKAWCKACSDPACPSSAKDKLRHKMQDALRQLSNNYRGVSQISLSDEQRSRVLTVTNSINDTIKGIPQLGLKSLEHFIEWSTGAPGSVSPSRRSHRAESSNRASGDKKRIKNEAPALPRGSKEAPTELDE